jgi:mono/diheme cytochrome c family protein
MSDGAAAVAFRASAMKIFSSESGAWLNLRWVELLMRFPRLLSLCSVVCLGAAALPAAPSAAENYEKHCVSCHGANGKAQTRLGKKSGAHDLTDKARMQKFADRELFDAIKLGRKDKNGEEKMEPFAKQLSDAEITELVSFVRRFSK